MTNPSHKSFRLKRTTLRAADYEFIAGIIRTLPDLSIRLAVADHFAKFFHGKIPTFDPQLWYTATGGLVNRPSKMVEKLNTSGNA